MCLFPAYICSMKNGEIIREEVDFPTIKEDTKPLIEKCLNTQEFLTLEFEDSKNIYRWNIKQVVTLLPNISNVSFKPGAIPA